MTNIKQELDRLKEILRAPALEGNDAPRIKDKVRALARVEEIKRELMERLEGVE